MNTRPLTTRAIQLRAATLNKDARTVEAVLATEKPVRMRDCFTRLPMDEILRIDGALYDEQVTLLDAHNRDTVANIRGSVRNIHAEGPQLMGTLCFDEDEPSDVAFQKAMGGSLTDTSSCYIYGVGDFVDIEPGQRATVRGIEYAAKADAITRVVTRWELKEVSLVPIGADKDAKLRAESPDSITPPAAQAPAPPLDVDAIRAEAYENGIRAERERAAKIRELGRGVDIGPDVIQQAIDTALTPERACDLFANALRDQMTTTPQPTVPIRHNASLRESYLRYFQSQGHDPATAARMAAIAIR